LNASVAALAPKLDATISSRPSPVIRDTSVSNETVEAARNRFIDMSASGWRRLRISQYRETLGGLDSAADVMPKAQ
jgi:hypothetical protein